MMRRFEGPLSLPTPERAFTGSMLIARELHQRYGCVKVGWLILIVGLIVPATVRNPARLLVLRNPGGPREGR